MNTKRAPLYLTDKDAVASSGYVPGLNGLRAISVLIVLTTHLNLERYLPGGFGVGVFFFISGFLITRLLLAEYQAFGTINIVLFLARRLLRLYPPLLVAVAVALIVSIWTGSDWSGSAVVASVFYFANYFTIFHPSEAVGTNLGHMWSLSVEEHFYLFYPPILLLFLNKRFSTFSLLVGGCLLALLVRVIIHFDVPDLAPRYVYAATETRMDFILAGALVAWICNGPLRSRFLDRVTNPWVFCAAIAMVLFSFVFRNDLFRDTLRSSVQITALIIVVPALIFRSSLLPIKTILNSALLDWIGRISYDLYLFHVPLIALTVYTARTANLQGWTGAFAGYGSGVVLSLIVAAASYRFIEEPMRRARRRLHPRTGKTTATTPKDLRTVEQ